MNKDELYASGGYSMADPIEVREAKRMRYKAIKWLMDRGAVSVQEGGGYSINPNRMLDVLNDKRRSAGGAAMSNSEQSFDHSTEARAASAQHTPGPWKAVLRSRDLYGQETWQVNDACGTVANEIDWAPDAPLIAAAPELLEALRPFANYACDPPCGCHNCRAREVVAKAEGR